MAMTPQELKALIDDVNLDIGRMARAAQMRNQVRGEIRYRADSPLEEQLIDEDANGQRRGEPRILIVNGVRLLIWKTHRAGLHSTDIKGADLYYEIEGEKYALIQYKTSTPGGRVVKDSDQLHALKQACPQGCAPCRRFTCGSWFALRDGDQGAYFPACEADKVFGSYASRKSTAFINGLTKVEFQRDFGSCFIGARTDPINLSTFRGMSVKADHLFFEVLETKQG